MSEGLSHDEICGQVKEYAKGRNLQYALLLNGPWGSGKTYFVKQYLIPELEGPQDKGKKFYPIRISLYGISDTEALKSTLVSAYYSKFHRGKNVCVRAISVLASGILSSASFLPGLQGLSDVSEAVIRAARNFRKSPEKTPLRISATAYSFLMIWSGAPRLSVKSWDISIILSKTITVRF